MTDEKVLSYVLVKREADKCFYWKLKDNGWTEDMTEVRRYARKASANYARFKLLQRPGADPAMFQVEALEE